MRQCSTDDMMLHCLLSCLDPIIDGLDPSLSSVEMVGQGLVELREPICMQRLHRSSDERMEVSSPPQQQGFVHDELGEHVLEHVLDLGDDPQLLDEVL